MGGGQGQIYGRSGGSDPEADIGEAKVACLPTIGLPFSSSPPHHFGGGEAKHLAGTEGAGEMLRFFI